jgi:hypothetical protein
VKPLDSFIEVVPITSQIIATKRRSQLVQLMNHSLPMLLLISKPDINYKVTNDTPSKIKATATSQTSQQQYKLNKQN